MLDLNMQLGWDESGKVFYAYFCVVRGFAHVCLEEDMLHFWMARWNISDGFLFSVTCQVDRTKVGYE